MDLTPDEINLIDRLINQVLLERGHLYTHGWAKTLCRDDLKQEAWEQVLKALPRWDPNKAKMCTFLKPRVRGAILDLLRQWLPGSRYQERPVVLSLDAEPPGEESDRASIHGSLGASVEPLAETEAGDHELTARVMEEVEQLPPRERTIVIGLGVEGRTGVDMAAQLGITESYTHMLYHRSCRVLRKQCLAKRQLAA
jgi:RNA polymerase sigma factor (sigma-70 family)